MDETEFWELIDGSRETAGGDPEEQAGLLVERLLDHDPETVLDFARHFESRYNRAYRWDLRPESLARHACQVAGRRLTRAEWTEFLPGRDYNPAC